MANIKQPKIINLSNDIREEILSGLVEHGKVKVVGLGIFETRQIPARLGRNPRTGAVVEIKSYRKIKFRPTKKLKLAVC